MTLLAPLAFAMGLAAAAVLVGLHLLTTRRPPSALLPTARFVPIVDARAVSRASRPTDLILLAMRVLAALSIGAAFAQPVLDAPGPRVRSVVLLDVSSGVADGAAAARAALERLTEGGAMVLFDTAAREVSRDSLGTVLSRSATSIGRAPSADALRPSRGALSPALVVARAAGSRVARGADSVRLVIVSPFTAASFDAATAALRTSWPGGAELVRVGAASDTAHAERPRLATSLADDPLAPAIGQLQPARGAHQVRIVRGIATAGDSTWARGPGRVLVLWPLTGNAALAADGVTALGVHLASLVAPLARLPVPAGELVVARWRDGSAAAVESALDAGCVRTVGVGIPLAGDLTLRAPFGEFLEAMVEPCGGARGVALPDSVVAWLERGTATGADGRRASDSPQVRAARRSATPARLLAATGVPDARFGAWLLLLALLALSLEWVLRRRGSR